MITTDGAVEVSVFRARNRPAWEAPAVGKLTLEVIDGGGLVLYREPVAIGHASHADDSGMRSARIPYLEGAATLIVRGTAGDIRATKELSPTKLR